MTDEVGATLTALIGAVLVRLAVTGAHRRYVKDAMGPWLLVAGVVLIALGLFLLVRALRARQDAAQPAHGHDHDGHDLVGGHGHRQAVAWFLVVPVLVLLLVAPPALGSFALGRSATVQVRDSGERVFAPLDPASAPRPMTLLEFDQRAAEAQGASFGQVPVTVTGFVARSRTDGFLLARYQIACCAADAQASVAEVLGWAGPLPALDTWVSVIGTFEPGGTDVPRLQAASVTPIAAPDDPYEG